MQFQTRVVRPAGLGLEFEVLADDAIIGPAIERGSWADHETRLFRAHLRPNDLCLDLGANVGWFAVQAVLAGAQVHAFEPVGPIADVCQRNLERAMQIAPGRGVVHRVAAGERHGKARIALAPKNHGDNRVLDERAEKPEDLAQAETMEIEIVPVDVLVSTPVRVIKIDTQGSEWLAIQGAQALFQRSPELALLFEFWPYALRGGKPEAMLAWLAEQGFTIGKATEAPFAMSPERILRQALARDPVRGGMDFYAVRELPFHVLGLGAQLKGLWRSLREP